jgi:hypothetical protein
MEIGELRWEKGYFFKHDIDVKGEQNYVRLLVELNAQNYVKGEHYFVSTF